jgi:O-antigen ligase
MSFERVRQLPLSRWASLGLLVLLAGAWFLPSSKLYHQLLIALLWLPALLALLRNDFRALLRQPELLLFAALAFWTLLVLVVKGGAEPVSAAKIPFYVGLSLLGIVLAALDRRCALESQLRFVALLGGILAALSVLYFYLSGPHAPDQRLIAIGLWDTAIMAAHAVGALAVLGVFLLRGAEVRPWLWPLLFAAAAGYLLFLGLSQTRGVWLAMIAVLLAVRPTRGSALLVLSLVLSVILLWLCVPELFLQRGLSYRPELLMGGLHLLEQNLWLGLGFNPYEIAVPAIGDFYKHPHNLYLDLAIRLGLPGLLLFAALWACVAWRGWQGRKQPIGRALLALWLFSSVALLTDGIGLWFKPNADWLITWLPIALSLVLAVRRKEAGL